MSEQKPPLPTKNQNSQEKTKPKLPGVQNGEKASVSLPTSGNGGSSLDLQEIDFGQYGLNESQANVFKTIYSKAPEYGLDPKHAVRVAFLESSFNPKADSGSAKGVYQFTDSTATEVGLVDPENLEQSLKAFSEYTKKSEDRLTKKLGRKPKDWELYAAHQQGVGGFSQLSKNPNKKAVEVLSKEVIANNGGTEDMTSQEFLNMWKERYDETSSQIPIQVSLSEKPTISGDIVATPEMAKSAPLKDVADSIAILKEAWGENLNKPAVGTRGSGQELVRLKQFNEIIDIYNERLRNEGTPIQKLSILQQDKLKNLKETYAAEGYYSMDEVEPMDMNTFMNFAADKIAEKKISERGDFPEGYLMEEEEEKSLLPNYAPQSSFVSDAVRVPMPQKTEGVKFKEGVVAGEKEKIVKEVVATLKDEFLSMLPEDEKNIENLQRIEKELLFEEGIKLDLSGEGLVGEDNGMLTSSITSFNKGLFDIGTALILSGGDLINVDTDGLDTYRKDKLKEFDQKINQYEKGMVDNIMDGNFDNAINIGFQSTAESLPYTLGAIAVGAATKNPNATIGVLTTMGAAQQYASVKDEEFFKKLNPFSQGAYLFVYGGAEGIDGMVGGKVFKQALKASVLKNTVGEAARKGLKDFVRTYGSLYGKNISEEAATEGITGAVQYVNDAFAMGDDVTMEGFLGAVNESIAQGGFSAGAMTTVGASKGMARDLKDVFFSLNNTKSKVLSDEINKLEDKLKETKDPVEIETISEAINELNNKKQKVVNRQQKVASNMSDEDLDTYMNAAGNFNTLKNKYDKLEDKEGQASEILKNKMKSELEEMQAIEERYTQEDILDTLDDSPVIKAIDANKPVNESQANELQNQILDAIDRTEDPDIVQILEDEFDKIESYDKKTRTITEKVTEKRPVGSPEKIVKIKERKKGERLSGLLPNSIVKTGSESEGEVSVAEEADDGTINIVRFNEKSKDRSDADVLETGKKAEEMEFVSSNLDEDGNVESVTLKADDKLTFTVEKRNEQDERPLDIAISAARNELGEIPSVEFQQAYEEVTTERTKEVPVTGKETVSEKKVSSEKTRRPIEGKTVANSAIEAIKSVAKTFSQGAAQQRKDIKNFAKEINDTLKGFKKGSVSAAKVRTIANRAASVTTERQMEKFIEYASKVLERASYEQDLKDVKRKQTRAKTKRRLGNLGSDSGQTKDALKVKVSELSLEELDEYNAMLSEMVKPGYNRSKVSDNIEYFAEVYRDQISDEPKKVKKEPGRKESPEAELQREIIKEQIAGKKTKIDDSKNEEYEVLTSLTDSELTDMGVNDLIEVSQAIENIENFQPISAKATEIKRRVVSDRNIQSFKDAVKDKKFNTLLRDVFGKLVFGDKVTRQNFVKYIKNTPLNRIDTILKGKKGTQIYKNFIQPISIAYSEFQGKVNSVQNAYNKVYRKVKDKKTFDIKASLIALQKQKEFNPNREEIGSVSDYIQAIKEADKKNNHFKDQAQKYIEVYEDMLVDGEFNWEDQYEKLSSAEKKAFDFVERVYTENADLVEVSAARNGKPTVIYEFYTPLNVMFFERTDLEGILNDVNDFVSDKNLSVPESKNFKERTKGAKPIYLDFSGNFLRTNRSVLQDYYLRDKMRILSKTINKLKSDTELDATQIDFAEAIGESLTEVVKNNFINTYYDNEFWGKVKNILAKRGYQLALASAPRATAEFISNLAHATLFAPRDMDTGLGFFFLKDKSYKANNNDLMEMVRLAQSSQFNRLFQREGGLMMEQGVGAINSVTRLGKGIDSINDAMVSIPDRAVAKPLWIGTFVRSFEKSTGEKINIQKFIKDSEYREKYKDNVRSARDKADSKLSQGFATMNPFEGIIAAQVKRDDNLIQLFDKYMTRFIRFEYQSLVDGFNGMAGKNEMSRGEALALSGATLTRMALYTTLYQSLSNSFSALIENALGIEGEREEDEEETWRKIYRGYVGSALTLLISRRLGNIGRSVLNFPIELMNREYGEMLNFREEDSKYSSYDNSLVFSPIKVLGEGQYYNNAKMAEDFLVSISGPYSKVVKATLRGIQLQQKVGVPAYFNDDKEYYIEPSLKTKEAIERNRRELRVRIYPELFMGTVGMPLAKDVDRLILREVFEHYNKKEKKKTKTEGSIEPSF